MEDDKGSREAARRAFARAITRSAFGRYYIGERDVTELKRAAQKRPKQRSQD